MEGGNASKGGRVWVMVDGADEVRVRKEGERWLDAKVEEWVVRSRKVGGKRNEHRECGIVQTEEFYVHIVSCRLPRQMVPDPLSFSRAFHCTSVHT